MSSKRTSTRTLRFMTFAPGEREALMSQLAGSSSQLVSESPVSPSPINPVRKGQLLKEHSFAVCFPDETAGTCRYERFGPTQHRFQFTYYDGASLPFIWWMQPLANDPPAIELKGKEFSVSAFSRACEEEKEKYFRRASLPSDGSRSKLPEGSQKQGQMSASRAKELAGRYAICLRHGKGLIAISAIYSTLAEANALWSEKQDTRTVVACFNRLYRCWEIPKYNPLYAAFEPQIEGTEKGEFPWSSWK